MIALGSTGLWLLDKLINFLPHGIPRLYGWFSKRRFRKLFGKDIDFGYYLVYPQLLCNPQMTFDKAPSSVRRSSPAKSAHNLTAINSNAITRAIGYLEYALGKDNGAVPQIQSDHDIDSRMDCSFISVGGTVNFKSQDVLLDERNIFLKLKGGCFVTSSGKVLKTAEAKPDYGLILKIHPRANPHRTWLCCAGFGEWGTSGAAWWLSNHWREIYRKAKGAPFVCLTRTTLGSDESTVAEGPFISEREVEELRQRTLPDNEVEETGGKAGETANGPVLDRRKPYTKSLGPMRTTWTSTTTPTVTEAPGDDEFKEEQNDNS